MELCRGLHTRPCRVDAKACVRGMVAHRSERAGRTSFGSEAQMGTANMRIVVQAIGPDHGVNFALLAHVPMRADGSGRSVALKPHRANLKEWTTVLELALTHAA
jgi:hypothetical protein